MSIHPTICLFSSLYLPTLGGVQTYSASIARAFRERGSRVIVVCCALQAKPGLTNEDGIEVLRLPCIPMLNGRYPIPTKSAAQWEWLKSQQIDYIEVHTRFYPLSLHALAFAESKRIVPVLLEHGSAHLTLGNPVIDKGVEIIEHYMTRRCLHHPAAYYAVSKKASRWLEHFGIHSDGELPNSIDADEYASSASYRCFRQELDIHDGDVLVAFVGRLVREKGVLELAKASKLLTEERIAIVIAGDGPLLGELSSHSNDRLHIIGGLNRSDVAALLSQSDAMCLPSRSEGFATSLLESAACGTPALVTNVGGVDELIPDENYGIILHDTLPETIVSALVKASSNRSVLTAQGEKVAKRVRDHFSWTRTADLTIKAFENAQR